MTFKNILFKTGNKGKTFLKHLFSSASLCLPENGVSRPKWRYRRLLNFPLPCDAPTIHGAISSERNSETSWVTPTQGNWEISTLKRPASWCWLQFSSLKYWQVLACAQPLGDTKKKGSDLDNHKGDCLYLYPYLCPYLYLYPYLYEYLYPYIYICLYFSRNYQKYMDFRNTRNIASLINEGNPAICKHMDGPERS